MAQKVDLMAGEAAGLSESLTWPSPAVRKAQCTARIALLARLFFDIHS